MSADSKPLAALALVLAALAARPGASPTSVRQADDARLVSVARQDGRDGPLWSVLCADAPLEEVLRAIARKSGLALEGLSVVPVGATATVELQRRPLDQVLDFVLGSHGLGHALEGGTLVISPAAPDETALLARAEVAWRVVEAEGDPRAAGRARLAQGNLAEVRGDLEAAYRVYAALAESEHGADSAEATFRAGLVLERLGHRAEAAQHFRVLSGREGAEAWHARARLELARVSIDLGDAQSALHLLNFLDANYPAADASERAERRLVRAQAHVALEAWIPALRAIEEGSVAAARSSGSRTLRIRATALEGLGFEAEAGRAWLLCARDAALAEEREHAFRRAAELALAAGDELAALFVCREAAKAGAHDALAALEATARARLGLDEEHVPATLADRLALAESLLARAEADAFERAAALLEGLYLARGALPAAERARAVAAWSTVLADRTGLDSALATLARERAELADPTALRTLDLAAAGLLEAAERFEEAAQAYRGVY
jgi:hypothetical protein